MNFYEHIAKELVWDDKNPLKSMNLSAASNETAVDSEKYIFVISHLSGYTGSYQKIKVYRKEVTKFHIEIFSRQVRFELINRSDEYKFMRDIYKKLILFEVACNNQKKRIKANAIIEMHNAKCVLTKVRAKEFSIDVSDFIYVEIGSHVVYLIDEETAALALLQVL